MAERNRVQRAIRAKRLNASIKILVVGAYSIGRDNAGRVPSATRTDRGFVFTGESAVRATRALTVGPPTRHLRAVFTPFTGRTCMFRRIVRCTYSDVTLLLPMGRLHSRHRPSAPRV